MRKGLGISLAALLAGGVAAFGQAPVVQPAAAQSAPGPAEAPRSPYWPNPAAAFAPPESPDPPAASAGAPVATAGSDSEWAWFGADYLLWWVKKGPLSAPLVTTGTNSLGTLGGSDTTVLYGGSELDFGALSGVRLDAGFWIDSDHTLGVDAGGLLLERGTKHFFATSDGSGAPVISRPVIDALAGGETAELVSAPGIATGNIAIAAYSHLWGWDLNVVSELSRSRPWKFQAIGGFRYLDLTENIAMTQNTVLLPGGTSGLGGSQLISPDNVTIFDSFATRNEFYGAQIGAKTTYDDGSLVVTGLVKVAIGGTHEITTIQGATVGTPANGSGLIEVPGGLLALTTNSGKHSHDEFAVVPELGINAGYQISPLLRVWVGYSFLYWSDVARPGDQIDRNINPSYVPTSHVFGTAPTPALPAYPNQRTDFWAQGVNFGLELRY
jgi:hypothetical protein